VKKLRWQTTCAKRWQTITWSLTWSAKKESKLSCTIYKLSIDKHFIQVSIIINLRS